MKKDDGRLALKSEIDRQQTSLCEENDANQDRHVGLLHDVLENGRGVLMQPGENLANNDRAGNPTEHLLLVEPLKAELETVGVIEVFQRTEAGPATQRGYLRFLNQMCELAGKSVAVRRYGLRLEARTLERLSMSTSKRIWIWAKRLLIVLAIIWIVWSSALSAVRSVHARRMEIEARQWCIEAEEDARATWGEEDAIRWLREHGISSVYRVERSGAGGHYYLVQGYRQIEEEGRLWGPTTVILEFLFDMDHSFHRVEYRVFPIAPP